MKLKTQISHLLFATLLTFFGIAREVLARPEYAADTKLNCVSCHVTPWGGGPRTIMGKAFGSHKHPPAKTSSRDLYYGSLRFIDYYPTDFTRERPIGAGVMEASVTGNVPILKAQEGTQTSTQTSSEMRGLLTFNLPTLTSANLREAYIRWQLPTEPGHTPSSILLGRFYVPFGLLTDEHRAYTRIQTNMTVNSSPV